MNKQVYKEYEYVGPLTSVTLTDESSSKKVLFEGGLIPGKNYKLPDKHPSVKRWLAIGYLIPATNLQNNPKNTKEQ